MSSAPLQLPMPLFTGLLKTFSLIFIVTGSFAILLGLDSIRALSPPLAPGALPTNSPVVSDAQTRFFGAIWAGYGMMLWWASNNVSNRHTHLVLLAGISFVSGVGWAPSVLRYGVSAVRIQDITAIDVLGALYDTLLWLLRVLKWL